MTPAAYALAAQAVRRKSLDLPIDHPEQPALYEAHEALMRRANPDNQPPTRPEHHTAKSGLA